MITVSLCMIVKNEEAVLARCLDSVADLMDEIIIVDTGSTDGTKEIARKYTERIYDFAWTGNFSDARNYSFSKASMEYIYCADADEELDEKNREKFRALKGALLPEIDLVQMYYANQLSYNTIYNYDKELRPKLYKRLREFVWEGAIHEAVRLDPVIYDSDIEILHKPQSNHKARDLAAFERLSKQGAALNKRLHGIYAKELMIAGEKEDFINAFPIFQATLSDISRGEDEIMEACCICANTCLMTGEDLGLFQYTTKAMAMNGCSEICCILGEYYRMAEEPEEAAVWYYNAAFETESVISLKHHKELPLQALSEIYRGLGNMEQAAYYEGLLKNPE